jgi:AraC-like DNA-binding protein
LESPQQDSAGALSTWRAQRVTAYIEAHLANTIRVRDLATLVGLSNSYFCHAFKRRYGLTVHVYLTCRRIELAQRLMLATSDSLSDIALSCGMSDQAHFTRAFRRVVGETPNRWRQSQRAALCDAPAPTVPVLRSRDDLPNQARL